MAFLSAATLMLTSAMPAAAQNLVTNGGFETGDFTGWQTSDPTVIIETAPNSGRYDAAFTAPACCASLSQTIATTAGGRYDFSFSYNSAYGSPNGLRAYFGGTKVFDMTDMPNSGYAIARFTQTASSADTVIRFDGYNAPGYTRMDDVRVTQLAAAAPEPATWALLILGGGLAGAVVRRRQRILEQSGARAVAG